jgi:sugar lactone lactonase YvrE
MPERLNAVSQLEVPPAELGEGPVWEGSSGELSWVDILGGRLFRSEMSAAGVRVVDALDVGCYLGSAVPQQGGGWMLAADTGFARLDNDGDLIWMSRPEDGKQNPMRMNDGACDPHGRFWAGSMAQNAAPGEGSLYRLDPDGSTHAMVTSMTVPNGMAWSSDGQTMWLVDSANRVIDAFDFDADAGAVTRRRTIVQLDSSDGLPDGLAVDEENCIWVAIWDGSEVRRYDPDGNLLASVRLPVSRPTSCCFGGDDLDTLFITSARTGLSAKQLAAQPHAGKLFRVTPGVRGLPTTRFAEQR